MHALLQQLAGGDRRSIGCADAVALEVIQSPEQLPVLVAGLFEDDPVIRMRAADALEKVSQTHIQPLMPFKQRLLSLASEETQTDVCWHLAQILPRLTLNHQEHRALVTDFLAYLASGSSIVNTSVMQAFYDIAAKDDQLSDELWCHIEELAITGTPAMKARGRKLLAQRHKKK